MTEKELIQLEKLMKKFLSLYKSQPMYTRYEGIILYKEVINDIIFVKKTMFSK